MNVIHFALTPLAGSPIRIVTALRKYTSISARLAVLNPNAYGRRVFENDLNWNDDKEICFSLLEEADIIHFHQYMDLQHNPFQIDFTRFLKKGIAIVRQFHTMPLTIAHGNPLHADKIINDPLPQLVIAQFQERYYPRARPVPNIIPINDELYQATGKFDESVQIFFSPSVPDSAWSSRWDNKGSPETQALLKRIARKHSNVSINIKFNIPHLQALRERQQSSICIDEMITGSYHLSSLEALSQGKPTFAYLDHRTLWYLAELTGTSQNPWMNFRLEDAEKPLSFLIQDSDLRKEIGTYSREWIVKYWNDKNMIQHYVKAYSDLKEHPDEFNKKRFDINSKKCRWFIQDMHDAVWESRSEKGRKSFFKRIINKCINGLG